MPAGAVLDPYAVLGVSREATAAEIASAHRRLAKSHHPDLHAGGVEAADRMREINEAWAVLSSSERRRAWDLEHPWHGTPASTGHFSGGRQAVPTATVLRAQVSPRWRTAAGDPRSARRGTVRVTPRPTAVAPPPRGFLEGPWAAIIAGALGLVILLAAVVAGRLIGV